MATRFMRCTAHPNGRLYFRVVEIVSTKPYQERTLKSLGSNPPEVTLMKACREYDCRLPRRMRRG